MKPTTRLLFAVLVPLLIAANGFAQNVEQLKTQSLALQLQSALITAPQSCSSAPLLFCGSVQTASPSCLYQQYYLDLWTFNAQAGQKLTVVASTTTAYQILVTIQSSAGIVATNNGFSSTAVSYTFPTTGTYYIGVGYVAQYAMGNYTLQLTCTSSAPPPPPTGNCSPNGQTMCLNGGRFAVSASYRTNGNSNGSGTAVKLTDDTGYFWFFSSSNVEAVVKVLNGCGLGGSYWIFAGGLTNVNVVLTIVDTKTGSVKTYINPLNTAFQPIQDTGAFSTCP